MSALAYATKQRVCKHPQRGQCKAHLYEPVKHKNSASQGLETKQRGHNHSLSLD